MIRPLVILIFCISIFFSACAFRPNTGSLADREQQEAVAVLADILGMQASCPDCLEAEVSFAMSGIVANAALPGHLTLQAPSSVRFEGVNSFGITETLLTCDGEHFLFAVAREGKAYTGKVTAGMLKHILPETLSGQNSYYYFIGRIPPGDLYIEQVERDLDSGGYWAQLRHASNSTRLHVLFNRQYKVLLRSLVIDQGSTVADFIYTYPEGDTGLAGLNTNCPLPERITVKSNSDVIVTVKRLYDDSRCLDRYFKITIPQGFERVNIE